ncbi:hypothetical protein [Alistipes sp.]|uniref:hypothetical protein n=1 Tax=Alistipes sp. TaxID=1872444 RepID=UPI003AEF43AB
MRRTQLILLALCSLATIPLQAQEDRRLRAKADSAAWELLVGPPARFPTGWLKEWLDPIQRERRQIRSLMEQRARQSVGEYPAARSQAEADRNDGLWRLQIGNTPPGNRSPYPDRELDARIIRFPLPRDMRADKRTEQQKALDKMRGGK